MQHFDQFFDHRLRRPANSGDRKDRKQKDDRKRGHDVFGHGLTVLARSDAQPRGTERVQPRTHCDITVRVIDAPDFNGATTIPAWLRPLLNISIDGPLPRAEGMS